MKSEELRLFELLKRAVADTFLTKNSASISIEEWKGNDIVAFQEDLFENVKGTISEKWFYTYLKNDIDKLPRIDMLNMLSNYGVTKIGMILKQNKL